MRVLVACEYSGIVRDAFAALGHDAWSCDVLPTERPGQHMQGDVRNVLYDGWDLMIAHPPCTHVCASGASHFWEKQKAGLQEEALEFFYELWTAPINRICIENPVGIISRRLKKPTQYIQPYEFGDDVSKKTGLWLHNLPRLRPTQYVKPRMVYSQKHGRHMPRWGNQTPAGQDKTSPSARRGLLRAATMQGVAHAMATQWGGT